MCIRDSFINGRSQGVRRKQDDHQYHVMWRVQFEPGEVRVVARQQGREVDVYKRQALRSTTRSTRSRSMTTLRLPTSCPPTASAAH